VIGGLLRTRDHHRAQRGDLRLLGRHLGGEVERRERARPRVGVPALQLLAQPAGAANANRKITRQRRIEDALQIIVADVEDGQRRGRLLGDALGELGLAGGREGGGAGEGQIERGACGPHVVVDRRGTIATALR
jgi:hypothetical protein